MPLPCAVVPQAGRLPGVAGNSGESHWLFRRTADGSLGPYRFSSDNMLSMCAVRGDVVYSRAIHCPSNVLALTRQTGDKSPYYKRPDGGGGAPFSQRSLRESIVPYPSRIVMKNKKLRALCAQTHVGMIGDDTAAGLGAQPSVVTPPDGDRSHPRRTRTDHRAQTWELFWRKDGPQMSPETTDDEPVPRQHKFRPEQDPAAGTSHWAAGSPLYVSCRGSVKLHGPSPWHLQRRCVLVVDGQHEQPQGKPVVSRCCVPITFCIRGIHLPIWLRPKAALGYPLWDVGKEQGAGDTMRPPSAASASRSRGSHRVPDPLGTEPAFLTSLG